MLLTIVQIFHYHQSFWPGWSHKTLTDQGKTEDQTSSCWNQILHNSPLVQQPKMEHKHMSVAENDIENRKYFKGLLHIILFVLLQFQFHLQHHHPHHSLRQQVLQMVLPQDQNLKKMTYMLEYFLGDSWKNLIIWIFAPTRFRSLGP